MSVDETLSQQVEAWLQPVAAERPCGEVISDDVLRDFREALAGKPDTQFSEAVPPDFRRALVLAEKAFTSSRDVRVAVGWLRAALRLRGLDALPQGLRLVHGLLAQYRDDLHPLPDPEDGAQYARGNALADLVTLGGVLGDLRQTVLVNDRIHGEIRVRSIEIATSRLTPREDETPLTQEQVQHYFASSAATPSLRALLLQTREQLRALSRQLDEQFQPDDDPPDLKPLSALVEMVLGMLPAQASVDDASPADAVAAAASGSATPGAGPQALAGQIQSRADVVRAIEMACAYLERAEPTNPAQLFLRRAKQLLDHDFLQLIQVLAPGALDDVARVMGVDPANVAPPNSG